MPVVVYTDAWSWNTMNGYKRSTLSSKLIQMIRSVTLSSTTVGPTVHRVFRSRTPRRWTSERSVEQYRKWKAGSGPIWYRRKRYHKLAHDVKAVSVPARHIMMLCRLRYATRQDAAAALEVPLSGSPQQLISFV